MLYMRVVSSDLISCSVSQAYSNQKLLDVEVKKLEKNAVDLTRQTEQWIQITDSLNQALKVRSDKYSLQFSCYRTFELENIGQNWVKKIP